MVEYSTSGGSLILFSNLPIGWDSGPTFLAVPSPLAAPIRKGSWRWRAADVLLELLLSIDVRWWCRPFLACVEMSPFGKDETT